MTTFYKSFKAKAYILFLLIALFDFLFFKEEAGWTIGIFSFALFIGTALTHKDFFATNTKKIFSILAILLSISFIYYTKPLSFIMFYVTLVALVIPNDAISSPANMIKSTLALFMASLTQWYKDSSKLNLLQNHTLNRKKAKKVLSYFALPIILSALFIYLFSEANPIFSKLFDWIDLEMIKRLIDSNRIWMWFLTGIFIWPFIRTKTKNFKTSATLQTKAKKWSFLVDIKSITFSLIVFNALFALQNIIDLQFLWAGNGTVPQGFSYAQYTQQGTYPLILTILIAAGYILLIYGEGQKEFQTSLIKKLTLIWIAQNILLTFSATSRLINYINAYSLTYWRLSALIWIALVFTGLILILLRISQSRSNTWLVQRNFFALLSVLYLFCFLPYGTIVAEYNVRHAYEITQKGQRLDFNYLVSLGSESALPALYWYKQNISEDQQESVVFYIEKLEKSLKIKLNRGQNDWRYWTLRPTLTAHRIKLND